MATPRRLNASLLKSAAARRTRTWISDNDGIRGSGRLVARICGDCGILLYFRYSLNRRLKFIPIGRYSSTPKDGHVTLDQARAEVKRYSALYQEPATRDVRQTRLPQGSHAIPAAPHAAAPSERSDDPSRSLMALCTYYADELAREKKPSAKGVRSELKYHLSSLPQVSKRAADLSPKEITDIIRVIFERTQRGAGKIRSYLSAAYERARKASLDASASVGWQHFEVTTNPVKDTSPVGKSGTRDRTLSRQELGWFWIHLTESSDRDSVTYATLRLDLLLGCQRAEQLLRCKLFDVDHFQKTVLLRDPKGNRSHARKHLLPLTERGYAEVQWLMNIAKSLESSFLFPNDKKTSISSTTISKHTLQICRSLTEAGLVSKENPFCFMDLRRTSESRMIEQGISKDMRAQLLSHGLTGVQDINYDRADYTELKLKALKQWEEFVLDCASKHRASYVEALQKVEVAPVVLARRRRARVAPDAGR